MIEYYEYEGHSEITSHQNINHRSFLIKDLTIQLYIHSDLLIFSYIILHRLIPPTGYSESG